MGNCFETARKSTAEIAPSELIKGSPVIKLYGPPNSIATSYIRFALLHKPVSLQFIPSETHETPVLIFQSEVVTGSVETMLRYLEGKFPDPPLTISTSNSVGGWYGGTTPMVVWVVVLQHRSLMWHLERLVRWAEDLTARGGKARGDPAMGSPRMEVRKFGRNYSQLLEMLLEHAQMEEKVVFPILESADRGLSKVANEEHARDLPLMNGIKEDIKSIGVLDSGSSVYQEFLSNLSLRLKTLKDHCKEHFKEEEKELLPLMEAVELSKLQQEKVMQQSLDVMRETHSHLFRFFMEGLQPLDAMQYLDMIKRYCDNVRVSLMLHMIVDAPH
ncbi:Hemerythrin domain-containing protein [Abeliophyllum distichum]|uniref:Hemerythrin domain-containing protein n=1 Tax=Abeliophyllum distichum TaxID=126358 RepID=A0ABD1UMQ0_9LAMI